MLRSNLGRRAQPSFQGRSVFVAIARAKRTLPQLWMGAAGKHRCDRPPDGRFGRKAKRLGLGMSETSNSDKPKATLHLKRPVEQGTVRQSFSHGRSKAVVVEKVKRRVHGPGEAPPPASRRSLRAGSGAEGRHADAVGSNRASPGAHGKSAAPPPPKTGVVLPTLTDGAARGARPRAQRCPRPRGGGSAPPGEPTPPLRREREDARAVRARGRRSAQARGGATPQPGSRFQDASPRRRRAAVSPAASPRLRPSAAAQARVAPAAAPPPPRRAAGRGGGAAHHAPQPSPPPCVARR